MCRFFLVLYFVIFNTHVALSQAANDSAKSDVQGSVTSLGINKDSLEKVTGNRALGYVIFKSDTIKGFVLLLKDEVQLIAPINERDTAFYTYHKNNLDLKFIAMFNSDNNPLYFERVGEHEKNLMRSFHFGKLNVYDGRIGYIYAPADIDHNNIVVSYNGEVHDLSSEYQHIVKKKLATIVNEVYGLHLKTGIISWEDLLMQIDALN